MDRKAQVAEFIKTEIMRNRNAQLDESEDLLGAGILDSLSILKLVAYISESFGIEVPDEDVIYENFHSLKAVVEYLQRFP